MDHGQKNYTHGNKENEQHMAVLNNHVGRLILVQWRKISGIPVQGGSYDQTDVETGE